MPTGLLFALVLIPSMLLAYVVLVTFYGANRAYIGISWLPLAYLVTIWIFIRLLAFQHLSVDWWRELAVMVAWASLVQASLGLILIVRAICLHRKALGVTAATLLAAFPFFFRYVNLV